MTPEPHGPTSDGERRLRLVGYNVRDLRGDRAAVSRVVRSLRPDVLCLQEAPRRPGTLHRTAALARATGLRLVAGGRGSGGTAVLVGPRVRVVAAEAARLPVPHWWTRTRGYAAALVRLPEGVELAVASVHLPLDPAQRLDHAERLCARLRRLPVGSVVVSADLNEPPGGPAWQVLGQVCHDPVAARAGDPAIAGTPTYPARAPRHRIDAVLASPLVRVCALRPAGDADGVVAGELTAASDHLPLVADLLLG